MKTIIDILKKGNQELFHSAMIAWLLDPNSAEHGLGPIFLNGIADRLDAYGWPDFKGILDASGSVAIQTEVGGFGRRYDIVIRCGEDSRIVIENKTKSIGEKSQFETYGEDNQNDMLVALGLCKESFAHFPEKTYPMITYGDVLQILSNIPIPNNDWGVLIKHYRLFLERTLSTMELAAQYFESGDISRHQEFIQNIFAMDDWTENDKRFLNLFLLEKFSRHLKERSKFAGFEWVSDKNQSSGAWLASGWEGSQPKYYKFFDATEMLLEKHSATLWFHLELTNGILAREPTDIAGSFQLRGKVRGKVDIPKDNWKFAEELWSTRTRLYDDENKPKRIKVSAESFFLIRKNIYKHELFLEKLEVSFTEFFERFGFFKL